jgi:S-adenosylmethionine:tRNA ribosyltransferase-isomerase
VLLRPAKRLRENDIIALGNNCEAKVLARISDKKWLLKFFAPDGFEAYLNRFGRAPLPPYIKRKKNAEPDITDRERYQTIYAKNPGSIAAPTAGLHFSDDVMQTLLSKGIQIAPITLHVGYGTFLPIESDEVEKHIMESEYYEISAESSQIINNAQRVIAVGTTSTRTLESVADNNGYVQAKSGTTTFFIYPGYKFKRVNGLLTNFHLPQSSLFLLVCAFAGTDLIKKAYQHAVENRYHFYSYGDCMLII